MRCSGILEGSVGILLRPNLLAVRCICRGFAAGMLSLECGGSSAQTLDFETTSEALETLFEAAGMPVPFHPPVANTAWVIVLASNLIPRTYTYADMQLVP